MPDTDALITVGKIIGTHGIKGQLKVYSYSGNIESLRAVRTILLKSPKGDLTEYELQNAAPHSGKFILTITGMDNINQVESLIGCEICLMRSQLPETSEDEYYWCDLIGLEVLTVDGLALGRISNIFETGSSDIYVVRNGDQELLIPAIADVIANVDLKNGKITVTPLEGLLDL
jgi:16S rRNA processing protein RimM